MFERFDERARTATIIASATARANPTMMGGIDGQAGVPVPVLHPAHLLLGALDQIDGKLLARLDVDVPTLLARVGTLTRDLTAEDVPGFSPGAKSVLEHSLREALRLGQQSIGPEHLILGVLREGSAYRLFPIDPSATRQHLIDATDPAAALARADRNAVQERLRIEQERARARAEQERAHKQRIRHGIQRVDARAGGLGDIVGRAR